MGFLCVPGAFARDSGFGSIKMNNSAARDEIVLFFTGGTITMRPRDADRGVVPSSGFNRFVQELGPYLQDVRLRAVKWSNLPSPHMTPQRMFDLAGDVDRELAKPRVRGAVIIHGTDVLVESAFMADLVCRTTKPVIYTGSMRYYKETGYDGLRNLLNAIRACLLPIPAQTGVALLMTDRLFAARDVVKIHALNIDAFAAPESGPIAYVAGETVVLTRRGSTGGAPERPLIATDRLVDGVPIIACYTGMDGHAIDDARRRGARGLVIQGFGAGNVPPGVVPALERMVAHGSPVVLTTQCPEGGVWPIYAYPGGGRDLASKGVISGGRLASGKARIVLMAALGAGLAKPAIERLIEDIN